jgi:hypothetical protein
MEWDFAEYWEKRPAPEREPASSSA